MKRNTGFTLIELLMTIAILAILISGMMLASGGMTASAKAVSVVVELRNLQNAGILFLGEHGDEPETNHKWNHSELSEELAKYMDNQERAKNIVTDMENGEEYWIGLLGDYSEAVIEKIISQANDGTIKIGEEDSPDVDENNPDYAPTPWIRVQ